MIGLMVLGALLIYGLILLSATAWMYRAVKQSGSSTARSTLAAAVVALLILAPVFWDAIPTYIAFKYYSQKEAGLKVFKTLEQWKTENPGVAETLGPSKKIEGSIKAFGKDLYPMNDRFGVTVPNWKKLFLSVGITENEVVDLKTGEVIVRQVGVGSGNSGGVALGGDGWWKPWLVYGSGRASYEEFLKIKRQFANPGSD